MINNWTDDPVTCTTSGGVRALRGQRATWGNLGGPFFFLLALEACSPTIPEGTFACEIDADCPPDMRCRAEDSRCWSWSAWPDDGAIPTVDAGHELDTGVVDVDASSPPDSGTVPDTGTPVPDSGPRCSGPIEEYRTSTGGFCPTDANGVQLTNRGGPWGSYVDGSGAAWETVACARWERSGPGDFLVEANASREAICGAAACSSCWIRRAYNAFDGLGHLGEIDTMAEPQHRFASRDGTLIICETSFPPYDNLWVTRVECL
jgi:hypothetical protein